MRLIIATVWLSLAILSLSIHARPTLELQSGDQKVSILEVYSSQGCSSCPPAERWVNNWLTNEALFTAVIPLVFHVDYWDYLGWPDPFAKSAFSDRQSQYKRNGNANAVYTPGFILNGKEWRGWFQGKVIPTQSFSAGNLIITLEGEDINATYSKFEDGDNLNIAILGFGFTTYVERGENKRKELRQEFVVLSHKIVDSIDRRWITDWQLPDVSAKRYALVAWVSSDDTLNVKQAVGAYLPDEFIRR